MSGYLWAIGYCIGCHGIFSFDPDRVPSIRISGERQPICRACVDRVNPQRVAAGLAPISVLPGAYVALDQGDEL